MNKFYQHLKNKFWKEQWNIGLMPLLKEDVLDGKIDPGKARWLFEEKKNGFFADPFVIEDDGKTYVFFEEFSDATGRGKISFIEISARQNKITAAEIKTALEKPFHLSYPFLFREHGQLFMIPESAQANEIAAYRPIKFPDLWKKEKTLVPNFPGVDPTVFKHGGRYWLFCTHAKKGENSHLYAFHSGQLFGKWRPHEKNPIKVDIEGARPAGPLFESGEELFRPAQNCQGTYGKEIVINKITKLSPSDFHEEKISTLSPRKDHKYKNGIHTVSFFNNFALVDAKRFVGIKKMLHPLVFGFKKFAKLV